MVIVSPDGTLNACYLLKQEWEDRDMNLCLGHMGNDGTAELDVDAVAYARSLNVLNKPFCDRCICKWHCAGGCHVNHALPNVPGDYDDLCLQTRIITLRNILKAMGRRDLALRLLEDSGALEKAVWQASDTLGDVEERL